jgi:putative ABC transport system permease protein
MITVVLRDMQWRVKRLAGGALATALVFAMTLLLGALHDSFLDETDRTVELFGGDQWVVTTGVAGPFTTNSPMSTDLESRVRAAPGVHDVSAVAIFRHVVTGAAARGVTDVNVIGYEVGSTVKPPVITGRMPTAGGEVAADESLDVPIGRVLTLAGHPLQVVGIVRGVTYNGGTPTVLIALEEAQGVAFDGRRLASALIITGTPTALPKDLTGMTPLQVRDDLRRPLLVATRSLGLLSALLWIVAAGIVGLICYLSSVDRAHDVAVLKAIGVGTWRLALGLLAMGVVIALAAAAIAVVLAVALVPTFPMSIDISASSCLVLLVIALLTGSGASIAGMVHVVRTDPTVALSRA